MDPDWREPGSVSAKNQRLRETLTRRLMAEYEGRPDLQRVMIPRHPPYGKRMLRDNGAWARALRQPNVTVVTDPIERITPLGIVTADGTRHELDVIIWCTGFRAWRFLDGIAVTGTGGADLHERWGQDPSAYLGITIPGFPNLFCLYGPNTNLVVNGSIVMFSECAVHYVMGCLRMLLERGDQVMDLRPEVLESYQATIDEANALMAWGTEGVGNWYKNPTGRVSQNWPLTTVEYWNLTREPDPGHYRFRGGAAGGAGAGGGGGRGGGEGGGGGYGGRGGGGGGGAPARGGGGGRGWGGGAALGSSENRRELERERGKGGVTTKHGDRGGGGEGGGGCRAGGRVWDQS